MNENLKKVLDVFNTDQEFTRKMGQCNSPEEAFELAKTVADGYTLEEFRSMMTEYYNTIQGSSADRVSPLKDAAGEDDVSEELTEEDLMSVSGGTTDIEEARRNQTKRAAAGMI